MKHRLRTTLGVLLFTVLLAAVASPVRAVADDTYTGSVVSRTHVTAKSPVREGNPSPAKAHVSSDVALSAGGTSVLLAAPVPTGKIRFSLDGQHFATVPLDANADARTVVPASLLPKGWHTLRADYVPAKNSPYQPSFDTTRIQVICKTRGACAQIAVHENDGLLPGTGGFAWWLLLIAAGCIVVGGAMVQHNRNQRDHIRIF